jgi:hypothetical protein
MKNIYISKKLLSFIAGVVDTADKHFETARMGYSGAQGKLIYEKNLKLKISCQTPFMPPYSPLFTLSLILPCSFSRYIPPPFPISIQYFVLPPPVFFSLHILLLSQSHILLLSQSHILLLSQSHILLLSQSHILLVSLLHSSFLSKEAASATRR